MKNANNNLKNSVPYRGVEGFFEGDMRFTDFTKKCMIIHLHILFTSSSSPSEFLIASLPIFNTRFKN